MNDQPTQDPNPFESLTTGLAMGDTFAGLLGVWLTRATAETGRAETAALKSITRRLSSSLGDFRTDDITRLVVQSYARAKIDHQLAPRTVENHLRVLRRAFAYGVRCGVVPHNPALGVKVPSLDPGGRPRIQVVPKPRRSKRRTSPTTTDGRPTVKSGTVVDSPKPSIDGPNSMGTLPKLPKVSPTAQPKRVTDEPKPRSGSSSGWQHVPIGEAWLPSACPSKSLPASCTTRRLVDPS